MQVLSDPIARAIAVLRMILNGFRSIPERLLIQHDGCGEAQRFGLVPEPRGSAVGTPAAGVSGRKLGQRNHVESGRPNVRVPGLGK